MGNEAMFWGGESVAGETVQALSDGAIYNPATQSWRVLPPSPLTQRTSATGIWDGDQAIVFGGFGSNGVPQFDGATYDPDTNTWHAIPALPLSHRGSAVGATAAWAGTTLIVWVTSEVRTTLTGSSYSTTSSQEAFSWKPGASSWSEMPSTPSDVSVYGATAIWTGQEILLFGTGGCLPGESCPARATGTGYALDPVTGIWTPILSNVVLVESVPETWTGQAVIALNQGASIGGPSAPILSPGDGAAYDPTAQRWLVLPRGPVQNLSEASVAWTGQQLVVWDGEGDHEAPTGEALTPSN